MKEETKPRSAPTDHRHSQHEATLKLDTSSVLPSFLSLYLFTDFGSSSKLSASWEQCLWLLCDHRASTVPSIWRFLTHGYDVIRRRGRSPMGLQLCGGDRYSLLRADCPSLQLSAFEYWVADCSQYLGGQSGTCRELEEAVDGSPPQAVVSLFSFITK